MSLVSSFLYSKLKEIKKTYPIVAPIDVKLPFITYIIDDQEINKTTANKGYTQNFVTITAYAENYDLAQEIADKIAIALDCNADGNIIGVSYNGSSASYEEQPLDRYYFTMQFSIYERG